MGDSVSQVEKLRAERDRIKAQLEEIESLIQAYEELKTKMQRVLSGEAQHVGRLSGRPRASSDAEHRPVDMPSNRTRSDDVAKFEAFVRNILMTADRPMNRNDILTLAEINDIPVGGQVPANTISARMARMGDVTAKRGVGYWLKSRERELFGESGAPDTQQGSETIPIPPGFG